MATEPCDFCNKEIPVEVVECPYCGKIQIEEIIKSRDRSEVAIATSGASSEESGTDSKIELASPGVIMGRLAIYCIGQFPFLLLISAMIIIVGTVLSYTLDVIHMSILEFSYAPFLPGSDFGLPHIIAYGSILMLFISVGGSTLGPQVSSSSTNMLWSKTVPAAKKEIIYEYSKQQRSWILSGIYCLSLIFFPIIFFPVAIIGCVVAIIFRIQMSRKKQD